MDEKHNQARKPDVKQIALGAGGGISLSLVIFLFGNFQTKEVATSEGKAILAQIAAIQADLPAMETRLTTTIQRSNDAHARTHGEMEGRQRSTDDRQDRDNENIWASVFKKFKATN